MSGVVAVTGSTGIVGGRVAARLSAAGVPLRLLARDPARAPAHPGAEVRRIGGYGAGDDVRAALEGADTLFLVPAEESADRVEQHRTAIEAAAAAGVRRIVYLSFVGAAPDATFTLVRDHWATEEIVRATGLSHTFTRMNLYMDFLPDMVSPDGAIRGPAGDGRVAAILREDVAAGVAAVLGSEGHDGRTYDLTGPSAFSPRRGRGPDRARDGPARPLRGRDGRGGVRLPRRLRRAGLAGRGMGHDLPRDPRRQPGRREPGPAQAHGPQCDLARGAPAQRRGGLG